VIAYHFGYNLVQAEIIPEGALRNPVLDVLQPFFAGVFIVLAGVSSRLSRSNLKRGLILLGCAALVTAVSFTVLPGPGLALRTVFGHEPAGAEIGSLIESGRIRLHEDIIEGAVKRGITDPDELGMYALSRYRGNPYPLIGTPILFGILHLLAVCILLYALLVKLRAVVPVVVLAAFFVLYHGIGRWPEIPSADYFPLVPWAFLFFFGVWLGGPVRDGILPEWFYRTKIPVLPAVGRKTLLIYLLHQPVLYGILRFI